MQIQSILHQLGNYFLEPWALALMTALIPLLIFYMVKPKPEEMMLPSLRFFMEQQKNSKVRSAIRLIRRNMFLLLHILLVMGLAIAAAQPFVQGQVEAEHSVLVLDRSASMNDDFQEAKNYLIENLGKSNTLITVDDDARIVERSVSGSEARQAIKEVEAVQTSTDVAGALRIASSIKGEYFIASDMDHSTGEQSISSLLDGLRASGTVDIMETSQDNSWGIVSVEPGRVTSIDVENFADSSEDVDITYGESMTTVSLEPGEVRTLQLEMKEGRNTVELEEDGYSPDNTAHVYVPDQRSMDVSVVGENRFLEKTLQLINHTEVETLKPGTDSLPESDAVVVTSSSDILPSIRQEAVSRDATVMMKSEGNMDALDLEGESISQQVTVNRPVNTYIGETESFNISTQGYRSYSEPGNAVMMSENGSTLVYNIDDSDFNRDFIYPVFWKRAVSEMVELPTVDNTNYMIGELYDGKKLLKSGFSQIEGQTVAVNHVDRDESVTEKTFVRSPGESSVQGQRNVSHLLALALMLLMLGEYAYLERQGDIR